MVRTFHIVERRLVAMLAAQDITLPQFDLLATLRFGEGVTQQELAGRLLVTKGNVCGLLNRLEQAGWVERRPDPADARANRLYLTPAGRQKIDSVRPAHDAFVLEMLGGFSDADVGQFRQAMADLESAAGRPRDGRSSSTQEDGTTNDDTQPNDTAHPPD
ncbi:MAG: transcriptional regulator [Phycisphaerales bacterium]|nr:transcriptional regulator [Phycisphaerales bacterium]